MQFVELDSTLRQAVDLIHRERFAEALRVLDRAPGATSQDAGRIGLRAEALAGLAEFDKASAEARQALATDPCEPRAHYVLGIIASANNRKQESVEHFSRSIACDPNFAPSHHALGMLLWSAGYREPAAREMSAATRLDPGNWRYAAGAALQLPANQRYAAQRQAYLKGLSEQPGSVRLRARIGGTYLAQPLSRFARAKSAVDPEVGFAAYQQVMSRRPLVTYALLVINLLVYIWLELHGGSTNSAVLNQYGAKNSFAIVHGHEIWRLFTAAFLHAGFSHLAVNSLSLYFVGTLYERCVGSLRFMFVYALAAIGGSVFSVAASTDLGVGASGAIFGIFGALGVYAFINRGVFGVISRKLVSSVIGLSILNLLLPLADPNIDGWAHVGGLVTGVVTGLVVGPWLAARRMPVSTNALLRDRRNPIIVVTFAFVTCVVLAVVTVLVLTVNPAGA
ncbi:MAG: rhomboid family intrarane serine protease [Chloroflexi bacterium]|nr:rhomboid family intrarane serine protease [Chloroflexota bacterium]